MPIGLSLGSNKSKTDQNKTTDESFSTVGSNTEQGTQTQASSTQGSQSQTTQGSQSGSSSTQGSTATAGTQTQVGTGSQKSLDDSTRDLLKQLTESSLAAAGAGNAQALADLTFNRAGSFDVQSFVDSLVKPAQAQLERTGAATIAQGGNAIGGTPATNSAAALLAQDVGERNAQQLAAITGDATARAEDIISSQVRAAQDSQTAATGGLQGLLDSLIRSQTVTAEQGTVANQTNTTQQQQSQTLLNSLSSMLGTSSEDSVNVLQSLLSAINSETGTRQGTEHLTGTTKGKSTGFGLSIGD